MNETSQQYRAMARRFGLGRNSLRRGSDRLETAVLWIALLASLLALPVSAAIGTAVVQGHSLAAAELRATGSQVVAHTLDPAPITPATTVVVSYPVRAAWTDAGGVKREGVVRVPQGSRAGTELTIWTDASGTPVEAPLPAMVSAGTGVFAGVGSFLGGLTGIWFLVWLVRLALDRRRIHQWQAEWERLAGTWCR